MFKFTPRQIPTNLVVIGCGGTGSRLIPMLAQFIRSITREFNPRGWLENPCIYLIDDDVVEQKNLLRQNFIEADVGKFKSVVLAQRYSRAYGVKIIPSTNRVGKELPGYNYNKGLFNNTEGCPEVNLEYVHFGSNCIYLLCVDSAAARRDILSTINSLVYTAVRKNSVNENNVPFIIDAGNEDNFGQVQFFSMIEARGSSRFLKDTIPEMTPVVGNIPGIPYPRDLYEKMIDNQSTASCADLDQTLAINAAMATTMIGIVQNFYYVKPFMFNRVGISLEGGSSTSFNTRDDLISRLVPSAGSGLPHFNGENSIINWFEANVLKMEEFKKASLAAQATKVIPTEEVEKPAAKKAPSRAKTSQGRVLPALPRELPSLTQINRSTPSVALQPITSAATLAAEEAIEQEYLDEEF